MKPLFFLLLSFLFTQTLFAREIILKNGKSYELEKDTIICQDRKTPKCIIDFAYVGKNYLVTAPNGKKQGNFKKKEDAFSKAKTLVALSVCEQVVLNYDEK